MNQDTIMALSSGQVRAGVSVFRISGPSSFRFLESYVRGALPEPRKAVLRWIRDEMGRKTDQALMLRFDAPHSFTGENMVELHCHGSLAVIEALFRLGLRLPGFRIAEPGEFSQRAFENGKLDLLQAEGIADIIDAVSPAQLHQAARFVAGDASDRVITWRQLLLEAAAFLAASIDFSDEGDVGESPHFPAIKLLATLQQEFETALSNAKIASQIRDGIRIAILGEPNVGKSTLLNALSRRETAIVSEIAGTTRDVLEVPMILNGMSVTFADTAGLRPTDDPVEAEGVRRARAWAETADLKLCLARAADQLNRPESVDLFIGTQADRYSTEEIQTGFDLVVSVQTGLNMTEFESRLTNEIARLTGTTEAPSIVRQRHQENLRRALNAVIHARHQLEQFDDVDLAAFEVSVAASALDQILGRVDVEDILGEVFSGFCVGK